MATILIADDSPASREFVREALAPVGYRVIEAADGAEALRRIRECRPDVVLLDLRMPPPDGYEVMRAVRADPACAGLPVAALTAFAMRGDRERALAAGFDAYISKPAHIQKLREQVAALVARAPLQEPA